MIKIFVLVLILVLSGCVHNKVSYAINKVVEKNVISSEENICSYETVSAIGTQSIVNSCNFAEIGDEI